jgi:hypothetical protein
MNEFILDTFADLCSKYDMKVHLKTKRTFSLYVMDDIPFELKEVMHQKVKSIAKEMGRSKYVIDNPYIRTIGGKALYTAGVWHIRIF